MELFFVPGPACLWGDDYLSLLYKVIFYTGKSIALGMGWENGKNYSLASSLSI